MTMMWAIKKGHSRSEVGILPQMLVFDDPRPAREQLHERYAHGGGWMPFSGFKLQRPSDNPLTWTIKYPEDLDESSSVRPHEAIAYTLLSPEVIVLFEHSWVAIVQRDGSFSVSRMD